MGEPIRSRYGQYYWQCPICAQSGGDTHKDNLLFNEQKGNLRCFACGGQKQVLEMINKTVDKNEYKPSEPRPTRELWYEANRENLLDYQHQANNELLNMPVVIEWLYNNHGINKQSIINCGIGCDESLNAVCFPIYSLNHNALVGFEYRQISEVKKIWRTPDSPSCIAQIYSNGKNLIVLEGYKDSHILKQMLELQNKVSGYTIMTPSNGVESLFNNLNDVDYSKYNTCYLLLDNDEAGDRVTKQVLEYYKFFIDKRDFLIKNNCKDVGDYWKLKYHTKNTTD